MIVSADSVRTIDGVYAVDRGQGPAVLLLHGIGSSSDSFAEQMAILSDHFRVVAWDAPGYARSADPDRALGMSGYADAAVRLLDHLGIEEASVVGVSWGAVIAMRLVARHRARVRRLVLASATVGSGVDPARAAAMRGRAREVARRGVHEFAARRAHRLLSPSASDELVASATRTMAAAIRLPGYRWATEAMAATDNTSILAELMLPVLLVVGEHDVVTPVEDTRAIAQQLPDARVEVVPGAGHLVNQERPDGFNRVVGSFLRAGVGPAATEQESNR